MAKKFRQEPDVQLIPYYEYDPSIHNVEYRYIPNQSAEGFQDVNYNYAYTNTNDCWRQPYPFPPRPFYGPYGGGFHPYGGMPYGGYGGFHPYGGYPGFHPWGGGWGGWHHDSPSR